MEEYTTNSIRNIALVSHSSAGKTILSEALLHLTGAINRMGKIEDGTTVSDFEDEEIRKGISLSTSLIPVEYKGFKINLLDTPGFTDFVGEMISALWVSDAAVVLIDAVSGVEVGTEVAWTYCSEFNKPRFVLVNKMDRENANFQKALDTVEEISDARLLPIQIPMGEKDNFKGVIDLLSMKAFVGRGKNSEEIPNEYMDAAEEARLELVEAAAEGDDELLMKYLDGESLSAEEVMSGLQSVVGTGEFIPVLVASASNEIGMAPFLDALTGLMPSPAEVPLIAAQGASGEETLKTSDAGPLAAYVWKTTADPFVGRITYFRVYSGVMSSDTRVWNQNKEVEERLGTINILRGKNQIPVKNVHAGDIATVPKLNETGTGDTIVDRGHPLTLPSPSFPNALYRVAVYPKTQADSTKMGPTLTRLCEEDMTLTWTQVASTNQTILQGMGDQHIDVALRKAEAKFQVGLETTIPKVPYQETITRTGRSQYRHKKQTGGAGQFAEVYMRVEPLREPVEEDGDENFAFINEVFGGAISNNFMPSIEKGVRKVMRDGVIAGFPVVKVLVAVVDGKEHPVDSKPVAFEIAGREAFKLAVRDAGPKLLEPIMEVRITVPEENMGDIMGDLNTRRARIQGMGTEKGRSVVTSLVPLAEMLRYTTDLRSMTGGRGVFTMEESHYELVPDHVASEIIAASQREKQEA